MYVAFRQKLPLLLSPRIPLPALPPSNRRVTYVQLCVSSAYYPPFRKAMDWIGFLVPKIRFELGASETPRESPNSTCPRVT